MVGGPGTAYNGGERFPSTMRARLVQLIAALWLPASGATLCLAQQVVVERDTPLYAEPALESRPVAQLKQGTPGEVLAKRGAWLNLKTQEASGWLFMFNVRFVERERGAGSGTALSRLFAPRQKISVTSTIGIRGLGEEDLRQAKFDAEEMKLLDHYAASKEAAEQQARASGLSAARVDYLEPK